MSSVSSDKSNFLHVIRHISFLFVRQLEHEDYPPRINKPHDRKYTQEQAIRSARLFTADMPVFHWPSEFFFDPFHKIKSPSTSLNAKRREFAANQSKPSLTPGSGNGNDARLRVLLSCREDRRSEPACTSKYRDSSYRSRAV
jgi:hypothetical protein